MGGRIFRPTPTALYSSTPLALGLARQLELTLWPGYNALLVALEVSINRQRVCLAGASGVAWCTMHWGRFVNPDGESWLRVGGREYGQPKGGDFYRWLEQGLQICDEVTVRIVESDAVDAPASTSRQP